jgi:hypothetical protein
MGWSSGSQLAEDVWSVVRLHVAKPKRKKVALKIYEMFCDRDADDWGGTQLEEDAGIEVEIDD